MLSFKQFFITENLRASTEKENAIIKDYQSGLSIKDIMGKHNIKSHKTIYDILGRNGLKKQNRTRHDDIKNQIISTYQQGIANNNPEDTNLTKLAQRFNSSVRTVGGILRQSGFVTARKNFTQHGNVLQHSQQKISPAQIEYINNLISKRDSEKVFEYSGDVIHKMVNNHIDAHPELNWYKLTDKRSVFVYIQKWQKANLEPGETRMDYGVKSSLGIPRYRKTGLPNHKGTRQQGFGALGPKDPSYRAVMGRAQDINDQYYQVK